MVSPLYFILHVSFLVTLANTTIRQKAVKRLCRSIYIPLGGVIASSQLKTRYECLTSCMDTAACTSFSYLTAPYPVLGTCNLHSSEVFCGIEQYSDYDWSTYLMENQPVGCPIGWEEHDQSCYLLVTNNKNWVEGRTHCESLGATLATISSETENQFIMDLPVNHGLGNKIIWLGGNDLNTEGVWEWLSGEPFTYTKWNTAAREPDGGPNENELAMWTNGHWIDLYWDNKEVSVCEKPL